MHFKKFLALLALVFGLMACGSSLYTPTENDTEINNVSIDMLKKGRELYISKCGSCHNLYLPSSYTKQEWPQFVNNMQIRAKIDNSQVELITKYLETGAKK